MTIQIAYPLHVDVRGRTAETDPSDHIRDMIEQVLFTGPGERVNRPTFGSGVAQLVFDRNGSDIAAATQLLVQGSLQQWLGDVIQIEGVAIDSDNGQLTVSLQYLVPQTGQRTTLQLTQGT